MAFEDFGHVDRFGPIPGNYQPVRTDLNDDVVYFVEVPFEPYSYVEDGIRYTDIGGASVVDKRDQAKFNEKLEKIAEQHSSIFEDVGNAVKNLAGGVVNGLIGSNLGDSNSDFRKIGEIASSVIPVGSLVGSLVQKIVAPIVATPAIAKAVVAVEKVAQTVENSKPVSVLSSLISFGNTAASAYSSVTSSPLGSVVSGLISGSFNPVASKPAASVAVPKGTTLQSIAEPLIKSATQAAFPSSQPVNGGGNGKVNMVYVWVGGAFLLLLGFLMWLFSRSKR